MNISRRDFLRSAGLASGIFTAPMPFYFLAKEAHAFSNLECKGKQVECVFTYVYNDKISMVIDTIRHYGSIVFRGFIVAEGEPHDFSRLTNLFPFPNPEDPPFKCSDRDGEVCTDLSTNNIYGDFKNHPLSFNLKFNILDYRFNVIESALGIGNVFTSMPETLLNFLLLDQEDYPLITISKGDVNFKGKTYNLEGARGVIGHHWGYVFPDYLLLMCNGFENPDNLLTVCYVESMTRLGTTLKSGYFCLFQSEGEKKSFVSLLDGTIQNFIENDLLCIVARHRKGLLSGEEILRVNIDYKKGKMFPNFFNKPCKTILDVPCEVIDLSIGKPLGKGTKGVVDVKGLPILG
ncbi:MAG TPA: hypothetical protein ACFYEM_07530 [Candidatus Hypogeohydataceae bacterium YC40]